MGTFVTALATNPTKNKDKLPITYESIFNFYHEKLGKPKISTEFKAKIVGEKVKKWKKDYDKISLVTTPLFPHQKGMLKRV